LITNPETVIGEISKNYHTEEITVNKAVDVVNKGTFRNFGDITLNESLSENANNITSEDISTNVIYKNSRLAEISLYSKEEGILAGISTGASLAAIAQKITELPENVQILTINYDTGERYWSVEGLFEENIISL